MITATDFFCGAGGSSTGLVAAGVEVRHAANHWQLAIETHNTNHPNTEHHLDDLQQAHASWFPRTDIAWFSPECFPAGTLVLAERGLIPIENVQVGERVLTHTGRWMPVTSAMRNVKDTVIVKGQGHYGLETTGEHPFYVRKQTRKWDNAKRDYDRRVYSEPEWQPAACLSEAIYRWATPVRADELPVPPVSGRGFEFTPDFWWMVGRWLGDGSLRIRETNSELTICCGKHEVDLLRERLERLSPKHDGRAKESELRWRCREIRTSYLFETGHTGLCAWLLEHFGQHADGKTIPAWSLTMPCEWRSALVEGYLSADGHRNYRRTRVDSVSKRLILGVRLLAETLGYRASFSLYLHAGGQIEGRPFEPYEMWMTAWETNGSQRSAFEDGQYSWSLIKSVEPGHSQVPVYNLSVAEDESYVADGIVVHNCTNHSLAKGRKRVGINQLDLWGETGVDPAEERSRATMREVVEFTEYHRYEAVIVENVVDIRHWQYFDEWMTAMLNLGYNAKILYLNAMFFGVPQSRDRFYAVFWRKGNQTPNLDFRPGANCPKHGAIQAVQSWKKEQHWGRYGSRRQYVYRCPVCGQEVSPQFRPAADVIDWSIPSTKIGDREKPLKEKTINRILAGLRKFGNWPAVADLGHSQANDSDKVRAASEPLATQTTRQTLALVRPFITSQHEGRDAVREVDRELPCITTMNNEHQLVVPPIIMSYHSNVVLKSIDEALPTIPTINHHHLVTPPFVMSYYGTNPTFAGMGEPLPTLRTVQHEALVTPEDMLPETGFRMLEPQELKLGMSFPGEYIILGNKRDQVRQIGNAVAANVAQWIAERVVESLAS